MPGPSSLTLVGRLDVLAGQSNLGRLNAATNAQWAVAGGGWSRPYPSRFHSCDTMAFLTWPTILPIRHSLLFPFPVYRYKILTTSDRPRLFRRSPCKDRNRRRSSALVSAVHFLSIQTLIPVRQIVGIVGQSIDDRRLCAGIGSGANDDPPCFR